MTPQQPGLPPHVQAELARRELKALKSQQAIAEQGIEALSNVAAELATVNHDITLPVERAMLAALMALCSIRLLELQTGHQSNHERMAQLEAFLAKADSRIAIPNLQV